MNELYQTLGVGPDASDDELKRAYRAKAKQLHPDLCPDDPQAKKRFQELNEAYETLSDPERRLAYDRAQQPRQAVGRPGPGETRTSSVPKGAPDFAKMQGGFAQFFGFDPQTGQVVDAEKLSGKKNPLDTSDLFKRFMGF